jgi:hypothetical protein
VTCIVLRYVLAEPMEMQVIHSLWNVWTLLIHKCYIELVVMHRYWELCILDYRHRIAKNRYERLYNAKGYIM